MQHFKFSVLQDMCVWIGFIWFHTVKCRFNERRSNEIFSKTNFFSGPHQFIIYLYVKMFHFNEYHCNENISLTQ
jgi:hypothetical protein